MAEESMKDKIRNLGMKADEFEKDLFDLDDTLLDRCTAKLDFSHDTLKANVYPKLKQMKAKYGIDIPMGICGVDLGRLDGKLNNLAWDKRSNIKAFKERFNGLPGWNSEDEGREMAKAMLTLVTTPARELRAKDAETKAKGIRAFNIEKPEDVDKLPPFASLFPDLAPKSKHYWAVESKYPGPHGWEEVTAEDDYIQAKERLREYNENEPQYPHRLRRRGE